MVPHFPEMAVYQTPEVYQTPFDSFRSGIVAGESEVGLSGGFCKKGVKKSCVGPVQEEFFCGLSDRTIIMMWMKWE